MQPLPYPRHAPERGHAAGRVGARVCHPGVVGEGLPVVGNRNRFLAMAVKTKQLHLKRRIFGRNQNFAEIVIFAEIAETEISAGIGLFWPNCFSQNVIFRPKGAVSAE